MTWDLIAFLLCITIKMSQTNSTSVPSPSPPIQSQFRRNPSQVIKPFQNRLLDDLYKLRKLHTVIHLFDLCKIWASSFESKRTPLTKFGRV